MLNETAHLAEHHCDVLVIGGGPAGSTAAALLAEKGHQVTLLEKAHHPRFHIGESLLPANLPLFDKLGVRDEIEAIGMEKWGAEFVSPWHEHRQVFEFGDAWDKSMPRSFQVRHGFIPGVAKLEDLAMFVPGRNEFRPPFFHADGLDFGTHAQLVEQG